MCDVGGWCLVLVVCLCVFIVKQNTAYELRISDWSSDVCSSDLTLPHVNRVHPSWTASMSPTIREKRPLPFGKGWMATSRWLNRTAISSGGEVPCSRQYRVTSIS